MSESQRRRFIEHYNFIDINANTAQLTQEVEITLTCLILTNFGITHIKVISTPRVRCMGYIFKMVVFVEFCSSVLLVL